MTTNLILTLTIIIISFLISKASDYFITRFGEKKKIIPKRIYYVSKFLHALIILIILMALAIVWNVQLGGVMVFASSIFAVIGVALFAQWSILSNLTSSIIIFFTFPSRIGDNIKIIDGDNTIVGEIIDISLFQIVILDKEGNTILYPNNLFIQKPIMKVKNQHKEIEKITEDVKEEYREA